MKDGLNDEHADRAWLVALRPGEIDDAGVGTNDDDAELSWSLMAQLEPDGTCEVSMTSRRCRFVNG